MKTSLWIIIALVTGIVGFLVGYSVSGFTGSRAAQEVARGAPAPHEGAPAAAPKADAGGAAHGAAGYGAATPAARDAKAGGSGGAPQPAPAQPQKLASEKPKAAGY